MHPIERLRYVARASGVAQRVIVQETAAALASFGSDPQGLVTACRRIVSSQPTSGPLLWLAARVLTSGDPLAEIWEAAGEIQADPTSMELAKALPEDCVVSVFGWPDEISNALQRRGDARVLVIDTLNEGSGFVDYLCRADVDATDVPMRGVAGAITSSTLVLIEASAIGPSDFVAVAGSHAGAAVAHHAGIPVWLIGGVGRLLPQRMWDGLSTRVEQAVDPWRATDEFVPLTLVDRLAGVTGPEPVDVALRRVDCPVAPELFKSEVF